MIGCKSYMKEYLPQLYITKHSRIPHKRGCIKALYCPYLRSFQYFFVTSSSYFNNIFNFLQYTYVDFKRKYNIAQHCHCPLDNVPFDEVS
jgi:hypothetical protein